MRTVTARIRIAAPPLAVWAALADVSRYAEWNPVLVAGTGEVVVGGRLTLKMSTRGIRVNIHPLVLVADPGVELRWLVRIPGVFGGEHVFALSSDAGGTRLDQSEIYSGLLGPLFGRDIDRIDRDFRAINDALKQHVEAG